MIEIITTTDGETLQRTPVESLAQAMRALRFYRLTKKAAWAERRVPGESWEILGFKGGKLYTILEVA